MKAEILMYTTIVLSVLLLQDTVNGHKSVSKKKMKKWSDESNILNRDEMNIGAVDVKNNPKLAEKGDEMAGLIEVVQLVVIDSFNDDEFRSFLIKRFLHSYLPQATKYLKKIKRLKKEMDPKSTDEDNRHFEAVKSP